MSKFDILCPFAVWSKLRKGGELMNVSLTPELESLVNQKVASGFYTSASEVVREALRLLQEQDEIKRMRLERGEINKGLNSLKEGKKHDGRAVMAELKTKYGKKGKQ